MSLPLPPEFGRPQPDDIVRIIEGVAFIEKQPLDFDPIQNAQWAMDRLCMVYRMELQQTCDPERERELLATLSKLSRFKYETDLTDTDNLRRIIEQADRIVTHYRDTGELDGPYEVEA